MLSLQFFSFHYYYFDVLQKEICKRSLWAVLVVHVLMHIADYKGLFPGLEMRKLEISRRDCYYVTFCLL